MPGRRSGRLAYFNNSKTMANSNVLQTILRDQYSGDVHVSTGMTTQDEIEAIVKFWEEGKGDAKNRLVLYNCTSGYPVPFEDVCLLELRELHAK